MLVVLDNGDENVNGTSKSDVLLIAADPNPKFVLAAAVVVAPVPPYATAKVDPFHVPEVIVPTVTISVPTNLLAAILPANCALVIPADELKLLVVNPVAEIVPPLIEIPEPAPAVKVVCLLLKVVQSVLVQ